MNNLKYFRPTEFTCDGVPCFDKMNKELLSLLDVARSVSEIPFNITSSWRSKDYNDKINGRVNSAHLRGLAVDIACSGSSDRYMIVEALLFAGFERIGIAKNFIHADIDETLPNAVIWIY